MLIHGLEDLMYQVSGLFLAPVLVLLVALFAYSLFALGEFAMQGWQRKKNASSFLQALKRVPEESSDIPAGYSLLALYAKDSSLSKDGLDVAALKELEAVRMVSRIAPMLGLIATMIPMGPALKSLSNGNIQGISENLIVAFAAVIFGLVIASITFWIATYKKRWLAVELVALAKVIDDRNIAIRKDETPAVLEQLGGRFTLKGTACNEEPVSTE